MGYYRKELRNRRDFRSKRNNHSKMNESTQKTKFDLYYSDDGCIFPVITDELLNSAIEEALKIFNEDK